MTAPLGVTFASLGVLGPPAATRVSRLAEDLGYQSFWTAEANGTDCLTLLGAVSQASPGLDLGTGILPIQIRTPQVAAMSAATARPSSPP